MRWGRMGADFCAFEGGCDLGAVGYTPCIRPAACAYLEITILIAHGLIEVCPSDLPLCTARVSTAAWVCKRIRTNS